MSGYARIHRSLIGHPAFRNDAEAMAFAWMVLRASWKPVRVRYKGRAVALDRGQLSVSQRDMADALDRDKAWIERLWRRLRDEAMIAVTYEAGAAVITICNYEKYQSSGDDGEATSEARHEADARQTQGTEQRREERKKKEGKKKEEARAPIFCLPPDIPEEPWSEFEAMRSRMKKPLSDHARDLAVKRLRSLAANGWPPGEVLNNSILNNYQGLFPPKETRNGQRFANDRTRQQPENPWVAGLRQAEAREAH